MIFLRGGLCTLFFAFLLNGNLKPMEESKECSSSDSSRSAPESIDDVPMYYASVIYDWKYDSLISFGFYNNQFCIEKVISLDDAIDREIHFVLYKITQKNIDISWILDKQSIKSYLTKRLAPCDMIIRISSCPSEFCEELSSLAVLEVLKIHNEIPKTKNADSEHIFTDEANFASLRPIRQMVKSMDDLADCAFSFQKPTYDDLKTCYENILKNLQEGWALTSKYASHNKPSDKWDLFIKKDVKDCHHKINLINLLAEKFGLKNSIICTYAGRFADANILLWVSKNHYESFMKIFKLKCTKD